MIDPLYISPPSRFDIPLGTSVRPSNSPTPSVTPRPKR